MQKYGVNFQKKQLKTFRMTDSREQILGMWRQQLFFFLIVNIAVLSNKDQVESTKLLELIIESRLQDKRSIAEISYIYIVTTNDQKLVFLNIIFINM